MAATTTTIVTPHTVDDLDHVPAGSSLWASDARLLEITGWERKPEGLCLGEVCVPVPENAGWARTGEVDIDGFWRHRGGVVASTDDRSVVSIGEPPEAWGRDLASLDAPDFTLPDWKGQDYSLSQFRGRKVFLATWASW